MWLFDQDNFLTKKPMPETPKSKDKEAFNAFVAKYNLDPLNNNAIMNCLFELSQENENAHKRIDQMQQVIDEWLIKNNEPLMEIYDKAIWYLKRIKEFESQ